MFRWKFIRRNQRVLEHNPWHFLRCFHPTGPCLWGTSLTRPHVPIGAMGVLLPKVGAAQLSTQCKGNTLPSCRDMAWVSRIFYDTIIQGLGFKPWLPTNIFTSPQISSLSLTLHPSTTLQWWFLGWSHITKPFGMKTFRWTLVTNFWFSAAKYSTFP